MASANPRIVLPTTTRKHLEGYPAHSRWLDTLSIITSILFLLGLFLDGWAHNSIPELETFFTPWHAVLYSGYFSVAILIGITQYRNVAKGYAWSRALPQGYGLSLLGVGIFFIGGAGDMVWHTVFGIEQNERHIGAAIAADVLRRELSAIVQRDDRDLRAFDDVKIRDDDAGRIDDEPGAEAEAVRIGARGWPTEGSTESLPHTAQPRVECGEWDSLGHEPSVWLSSRGRLVALETEATPPVCEADG